jgi:flagellar basal-body rod protein FlgC
MSLFNVFDVAGSGMSAQSLRLNTTASNLANAESISSSVEQTYRARHPVFSAIYNDQFDSKSESVGVRIDGIVESQAPLNMRYEPNHPMANEEGYVFVSNVNVIEEMANMISASRSYQNNVEVLSTSKQLLQQTLRLGE